MSEVMWCLCLCSVVFSVFGGSFSRWKPVKAFLFCFSAAATYVLPRDVSCYQIIVESKDCFNLTKENYNEKEDYSNSKLVHKSRSFERHWTFLSSAAMMSYTMSWINYLGPDIKRGHFTNEEEENIIKLHEMLGNSS
ncbi:hypothetical protein P8452_39716 [Trifolium repens]|nr:hypothetical protein P8452_39716 [Trifolium repens]